MDLAKFKRSPTGKLVKTPQGYWAFVPHPLPPRLAYDDALVALLSQADRAIPIFLNSNAFKSFERSLKDPPGFLKKRSFFFKSLADYSRTLEK